MKILMTGTCKYEVKLKDKHFLVKTYLVTFILHLNVPLEELS